MLRVKEPKITRAVGLKHVRYALPLRAWERELFWILLLESIVLVLFQQYKFFENYIILFPDKNRFSPLKKGTCGL